MATSPTEQATGRPQRLATYTAATYGDRGDEAASLHEHLLLREFSLADRPRGIY